MITSRRLLIPPSIGQLFGQSWTCIVVFSAELCSLFLYISSVMQYLMYTCFFSQTIPLLRIHERLIVYFQLIDRL